jgi:hypothetical protein
MGLIIIKYWLRFPYDAEQPPARSSARPPAWCPSCPNAVVENCNYRGELNSAIWTGPVNEHYYEVYCPSCPNDDRRRCGPGACLSGTSSRWRVTKKRSIRRAWARTSRTARCSHRCWSRRSARSARGTVRHAPRRWPGKPRWRPATTRCAAGPLARDPVAALRRRC